MRIVFNQDGSVRERLLDRYVNQNSGDVSVDIEVHGLAPSSYGCVANFLLPNGQRTTEPMTRTQGGYSVPITTSETHYSGVLTLSVSITAQGIDWTYPINIVVNGTMEYLVAMHSEEYQQLFALFNQGNAQVETNRRDIASLGDRVTVLESQGGGGGGQYPNDYLVSASYSDNVLSILDNRARRIDVPILSGTSFSTDISMNGNRVYLAGEHSYIQAHSGQMEFRTDGVAHISFYSGFAVTRAGDEVMAFDITDDVLVFKKPVDFSDAFLEGKRIATREYVDQQASGGGHFDEYGNLGVLGRFIYLHDDQHWIYAGDENVGSDNLILHGKGGVTIEIEENGENKPVLVFDQGDNYIWTPLSALEMQSTGGGAIRVNAPGGINQDVTVSLPNESGTMLTYQQMLGYFYSKSQSDGRYVTAQWVSEQDFATVNWVSNQNYIRRSNLQDFYRHDIVMSDPNGVYHLSVTVTLSIAFSNAGQVNTYATPSRGHFFAFGGGREILNDASRGITGIGDGFVVIGSSSTAGGYQSPISQWTLISDTVTKVTDW